MRQQLFQKIKEYHFQLKHLLVLFIVLIFFQISISYIQKISLEKLLDQTQNWYQQDSAEQLANLTTTSLELLLESYSLGSSFSKEDQRNLIQAFNIILSQQFIQHNVDQMCILVESDSAVYVLDDGMKLYSHFYASRELARPDEAQFEQIITAYRSVADDIQKKEEIITRHLSGQVFEIFVPLVPHGEYSGTVFMKIRPDFSFISHQFSSSYDETAIIFSALILFGLMAMFYISSYTLRERDEAQELLFAEQEERLRSEIDHKKETLFTKRIYHTHHKAEKVMGFIKEDLRAINAENIGDIKYRVTKYANFISRVIYDMKWYDPPLQTIRNPIFKTNLNEVLDFIIRHIFFRVSRQSERIKIETQLDEQLPAVSINEFVVWEILEPLIQNSIDHAPDGPIHIRVKTHQDAKSGHSYVFIEDDGKGIAAELLEPNSDGVKKIFLENISTKSDRVNSGYGCYLAHEIARRCGWSLDVENRQSAGCRFIIQISH